MRFKWSFDSQKLAHAQWGSNCCLPRTECVPCTAPSLRSSLDTESLMAAHALWGFICCLPRTECVPCSAPLLRTSLDSERLLAAVNADLAGRKPQQIQIITDKKSTRVFSNQSINQTVVSKNNLRPLFRALIATFLSISLLTYTVSLALDFSTRQHITPYLNNACF